jgi:hypothetical protein
MSKCRIRQSLYGAWRVSQARNKIKHEKNIKLLKIRNTKPKMYRNEQKIPRIIYKQCDWDLSINIRKISPSSNNSWRFSISQIAKICIGLVDQIPKNVWKIPITLCKKTISIKAMSFLALARWKRYEMPIAINVSKLEEHT